MSHCRHAYLRTNALGLIQRNDHICHDENRILSLKREKGRVGKWAEIEETFDLDSKPENAALRLSFL